MSEIDMQDQSTDDRGTPGQGPDGELVAAREALAAERERATAAEAALSALQEQMGKERLLRQAGLGEEYACFLSGDADMWAAQVEALTALRSHAAPTNPIPRDPAIDADHDMEPDQPSATRFLNDNGIGYWH